jgi:hypothetical protein
MKRIVWLILAAAWSAHAGEITVSASGFESKAAGGWADFPPELTLDGDLGGKSSWRVEVEDVEHGEWIQYDLGEIKTIESVNIAFLSGDKRSYKFKIELSVDGEGWSEVFTGASGGQAGLEAFDAKNTPARYVRLTGTGNTGIGEESPFPKWFNVIETEISAH